MNRWDTAIIEARRIAVKKMVIPKETEHFYISKDLKAGKLVFTAKERLMTTRKNINTNYLQYDTRTV